MPKCRCTPTCTSELAPGDPIVEVKFYDTGRIPMMVKLEHLLAPPVPQTSPFPLLKGEQQAESQGVK